MLNAVQEQDWEPEGRTVRLIEWSLAGQPGTGDLPEGASEILAGQRSANLFETWDDVRRFGASAAESLRQAYGLPEELTRPPEGLVTAVQAPLLSDGIAAMLLDEHEWTEREWATREALGEYLYRRARNILWKRMRAEDRQNRAIMRAEVDAYAERIQSRGRMELLADMRKVLRPVKRQMPELDRHFRVLADAADPKTAEVDWQVVARRYRIPEERIVSFIAMIERRWKPELDGLLVQMGLYVRRYRVQVDEKGIFRFIA